MSEPSPNCNEDSVEEQEEETVVEEEEVANEVEEDEEEEDNKGEEEEEDNKEEEASDWLSLAATPRSRAKSAWTTRGDMNGGSRVSRVVCAFLLVIFVF